MAPMNGLSLRALALSFTVCASASASACVGDGAIHDRAAKPPTALASSASAAPKESDAAPILGPEASAISFEQIAKYPEPGWQIPRKLQFQPRRNSTFSFLMSEDGSDEMSLFVSERGGEPRVVLRARDLEPEPSGPSLAQELRDERQRKKIKGITEYSWAGMGIPNLLVPYDGHLYLRNTAGTVSRLTEKPGALDAKFCEDASKVVFVRDNDLAVIDMVSKKERPLTRRGASGIQSGGSDFNAQEEFDEPSGFFLTPDCSKVAYLEVDERAVPEVPLLGFRNGKPSASTQRYPVTGGKNPLVTLKVLDLEGGTPKPVKLPQGVSGNAYLGRFRITRDSQTLVFYALERSQRSGALVAAPLDGRGPARVLVRDEVARGWLEMPDVVLSADDRAVFTTADKGGHVHLRHTALAGGPTTFDTAGDFDVTAIVGVNRQTREPLVMSNKSDPIGRRPFRVKADGSLAELAPEAGFHDVTLSTNGDTFLDVWSSAKQAPSVRFFEKGAPTPLRVPADPRLAGMSLRQPEVVELAAADGTRLYGALLAPRTVDPKRRYPLVLMVYGGPGVQTVQDRWAPRLLWQHLADRGFFVLQVDNRGSGGRGPAFAQAIDRKLGQVELADQLAALDQVLAKHPEIDAARTAIYGHSYGGFMAAYAMFAAPDRFRLGIAGSPVTDWRLYDSAYTERYMGTPEENPTGYDAVDLEKLAPKLSGRLLLIHALLDENVHFQNTADLVDALTRAQKDFEMFVFPGERHGYRSPAAKAYASELVTRRLVQALSHP